MPKVCAMLPLSHSDNQKGIKNIISNYCLHILASAIGSYQVPADIPLGVFHSPNVPSCAIQQNTVIVFFSSKTHIFLVKFTASEE